MSIEYKEEGFTMKDVPEEVLEVWAIEIACSQSNTGVGLETYRKCKTVVEKYPEWFTKQSQITDNQ